MSDSTKPSVLVVDDEESLCTLLRYNLEREGYTVHQARNGGDALSAAVEISPDLIILDWMLPELSGIEICRRLRARRELRSVPIIMLTAKNEESDRIRGLDTGADEYIVKPFSMPEFLARIRAVMRRVRPRLLQDVIAVGEISMDRVSHRVHRSSREVHLGPTEYRILERLMQYPGRVFSRDQLLDGIWGASTSVEDRTVDVHIGRLRKALSQSSERDPIRTVRSAGYSFDETFAI